MGKNARMRKRARIAAAREAAKAPAPKPVAEKMPAPKKVEKKEPAPKKPVAAKKVVRKAKTTEK